MYNLYERIAELCKEHNVTPGKMCSTIGISRGLITDLKMGRKSNPTAETLSKIASYFDVSVDYLIGNTNTKKETSDTEVSDEDLKIALFHGATDVTDEMWEEAREYARFIYERERKKREKN